MTEKIFQSPEARYILPTFEERTSYGFKRQDPYNKLFEDRIVFLGVQVDDASADDIMAQLLVLESQDPETSPCTLTPQVVRSQP
jgi:ATP-dependent Clp protease protease subunit